MKKRNKNEISVDLDMHILQPYLFSHICMCSKFNKVTEEIFRILVNSLVEGKGDADEKDLFVEIIPDEICEKLGIDTKKMEKSLEQVSKATIYAEISSEIPRKKRSLACYFYVFIGKDLIGLNDSRKRCFIFAPVVAERLILQETRRYKGTLVDSFFPVSEELKG